MKAGASLNDIAKRNYRNLNLLTIRETHQIKSGALSNYKAENCGLNLLTIGHLDGKNSHSGRENRKSGDVRRVTSRCIGINTISTHTISGGRFSMN